MADAGLLAGRPAVTHWLAFDLLAQRHPQLVLDESVPYVVHGDVLTSADTASGPDACLHLVRRLPESTDRPIDTIAAACGIGSPVTLRPNFSAAFNISPSQYRARFRAEAADTEERPRRFRGAGGHCPGLPMAISGADWRGGRTVAERSTQG